MAYEFGREWPSYVPRGEVTWLLGRIHVCASDAEVRQELESRRPKQATDEQFETIVAYALAIHADNRQLCKDFRL